MKSNTNRLFLKTFFRQQSPVNENVLTALLGAGMLLAYLFYWDQGVDTFALYLYNFYLKDWPLHLDLILPILVWTVTILSSLALIFLARFRVFTYLILAACVYYLKNYSIFAQCSWGDTLPPLFFLLAINSWVAPEGKISLIILRGLELILALIYFSSVTQRLLDPYWMRGEITQLLLESRTFSRWPEIDWNQFSGLLKFATYLVFITESLGAFLPFLGRFRKYVILMLVSVHLLIGISSTEMVWQLFVLSLLFVSYHQESKHFVLSFRQKIAAALVVIPLYLAALPFNSPVTFLNPVVASSRNALQFFGLLPLTQRRVFHTKPTYATCFFIYGETGDQITKIWSSDTKQCLLGQNYLFQDNFLHSAVRATLDIYGPEIKSNHLEKIQVQNEMRSIQEDISNRWGYSACKRYSKDIGSLDAVFLFTINVFHDQTFHLRPLTLSHFSCKKFQNEELQKLNTRQINVLNHEIQSLKAQLPQIP